MNVWGFCVFQHASHACVWSTSPFASLFTLAFCVAAVVSLVQVFRTATSNARTGNGKKRSVMEIYDTFVFLRRTPEKTVGCIQLGTIFRNTKTTTPSATGAHTTSGPTPVYPDTLLSIRTGANFSPPFTSPVYFFVNHEVRKDTKDI